MTFLNIGILEIILLLVVMIIFLGPEQVVDMAGKFGRFIRKITRSEFWTTVSDTSREIRRIHKTLVEETGLEESIQDIKQTTDELQGQLSEVQDELSEEASVQLEEFEQTKADLNGAVQELKKRTKEK
jgi:Sec-independent protein translocase protein TatA